MTLYRYGVSMNKPFCNGSHASIKFKDGLYDFPAKKSRSASDWVSVRTMHL